MTTIIDVDLTDLISVSSTPYAVTFNPTVQGQSDAESCGYLYIIALNEDLTTEEVLSKFNLPRSFNAFILHTDLTSLDDVAKYVEMWLQYIDPKSKPVRILQE